ncbi:MAG TPA: hypothetical protein DCZ44_05270 [Flavobacteriaceae bacterium]|nr:hypothetical protein [Flavobacteriaceae bacterium]
MDRPPHPCKQKDRVTEHIMTIVVWIFMSGTMLNLVMNIEITLKYDQKSSFVKLSHPKVYIIHRESLNFNTSIRNSIK